MAGNPQEHAEHLNFNDPATEQKQDDIISELQLLKSLQDNYAVRVEDDSGDCNISYIGIAEIGSIDSGAVWQIQKADQTSGTIITWADGNDNFDNIWDNRESLSYS